MPEIICLSEGPPQALQPPIVELPHVLLVVDGFPKVLGGGERIALRLAELLPRYGFRASILTFSLHPESIFRPSEAPCPFYLLPLQRTYDAAALRGALALRTMLRDQKIRIVQTFFESSDLWAGSIARLTSSAKVIWSRRDMGILRGRKHALAYRIMRRLPHAVFAVSAEVARHAMEVDGIPSERVQTIHNGLELQKLILGPPRLGEAPVITTVGNIRRVKGHDLLIRAAAAVVARFPRATFTVAGEVLEPDFFRELQQLVDQFGLGEHFRFVGKISDLGSHFAKSDIFILPSRSEGFSNALIEAMACGLPSIATTVGGNAEAIEDGVSGLLVPPEQPEAMTAALLRLLDSPDLAARMGSAGRETVLERFSADAMMRKIASGYSALLNYR